MKSQNRISQLTLELYYRGLATRKENKLVEKALQTDNELRKRYEALQKSDREIKQLAANELRRLNGGEKPPVPVVQRKKTIWIMAAAILLSALIPAILYLKGSGANNDTAIAEETIREINPPESTELAEDIHDENMPIERTFIVESPGPEPRRADEPELRIEPENGVSIAVLPEPVTGIRTRGSQTEEETPLPEPESNLNIPPGITLIFENMFADRNLAFVIIPSRITSIGNNAFSGNPLVSVTIGPNVSIEDNAIPGNFAAAYNGFDKTAGTYSRPDVNSEVWSKTEF